MLRSIARIFGLVFFALGFYILLSSFSSVTGFAVINAEDIPYSSIWGVAFLIVGAFLLSIASRISDIGGIERRVMSGSPSVVWSVQARERMRKDNFVRGNKKKYVKEVEMIAQSPKQRGQERIGQFSVSPRGHNNIRVAWHYDSKTNTIYVDDLLYHKNGRTYVDNWNNRATDGEITKGSYSGYGSIDAEDDEETREAA
ncbi:MAG: hypothetical protein AABW79_01500 [Nanoarchaeota archaeon]